jgi:hypothetical protein
MLWQRKQRGSAPDKFLIRSLKPQTDGQRDAVAKTQGCQITACHSLGHRGIAHPVIGNGKVNAAARKERAGQTRLYPRIGNGFCKADLGPTIKGHMRKCGLQNL